MGYSPGTGQEHLWFFIPAYINQAPLRLLIPFYGKYLYIDFF
jgi:hypothetical protein